MKNITIGMDLGDKINLVCVLDNVGNVKQSISIENTMEALKAFFINFKGAKVAIEAGTHSPWISRLTLPYFFLELAR